MQDYQLYYCNTAMQEAALNVARAWAAWNRTEQRTKPAHEKTLDKVYDKALLTLFNVAIAQNQDWTFSRPPGVPGNAIQFRPGSGGRAGFQRRLNDYIIEQVCAFNKAATQEGRTQEYITVPEDRRYYPCAEISYQMC